MTRRISACIFYLLLMSMGTTYGMDFSPDFEGDGDPKNVEKIAEKYIETYRYSMFRRVLKTKNVLLLEACFKKIESGCWPGALRYFTLMKNEAFRDATYIENNDEVLSFFLKSVVDINDQDCWGTALDYAIRWGRVENVQFLLEHGADIVMSYGHDELYHTLDTVFAGFIPSKMPSFELIEKLLAYGAMVETVNAKLSSPLFKAVCVPSTIKSLLRSGADPYAKWGETRYVVGETSLARACWFAKEGKPIALDCFLRNGCIASRCPDLDDTDKAIIKERLKVCMIEPEEERRDDLTLATYKLATAYDLKKMRCIRSFAEMEKLQNEGRVPRLHALLCARELTGFGGKALCHEAPTPYSSSR